MIRLIAVFALALTAACGADGDPVAPGAKPVSGITVTGDASLGVVSGEQRPEE